MRAPGPTRKDGSWLRSSEVEMKDDEACSFDCIVSIFAGRRGLEGFEGPSGRLITVL
jgi:hypothetical protein